MRTNIAKIARGLMHASAILGWLLVGMLILYAVGGAFSGVDTTILFLVAIVMHWLVARASEMDHYVINLCEGDDGFEEMMRIIQKEHDDEG
jgi:hypothetical protein